MANIVITGASNGIGFETALALAKQGNQVLAIARTPSGLAKLQSAVANEKHAQGLYVLPFDIINGDYEQVLIPIINDKLRPIHVLINNAGALINKPFTQTSVADFVTMTQSNLIGHVQIIQHLLPYMATNSHIVNIGSMGGFQGSVKFPGLAAYSASKAALHTLTECLALEFADMNIKINCLALGSAQTEMLAKAFPGYKSPVTASEMGKYIAQFALTGHQFFNGKILPVAVTTP